jgi:hypothetical protein
MFDSLDSYNRFIAEVDRDAVGNARRGLDDINPREVNSYIRQQGVQWYGTTDASSVLGNLNTYLFNPQLDSFLTSFRGQTVNVDVVDIDQQKAIKFTDLEIGIFSYDLASLGLIPVVEYYSPLLNEVVSGNVIIGEKNQDGKTIFYHVYTPFIPLHKVTFELSKNGYYSEILKRNLAKSELIEVVDGNDIYMAFPERNEIPKHIVEQRQKLDDNGRKKFSSTFKKSFIYIPNVEKPLPRIDIICTASYPASVNAQTQMIYSSMAAIAIAEKLSQSGVNFRIVACYAIETSGAGTAKKVFPFVTLKKEGEALDKNKMSVLLSDGRQFRYQQFKGFLATQFDAGYDSNINAMEIGRAIRDTISVKEAYIEFLSKQDNPEDRLAAENPRSKIVFNGSLTESEARAEYQRVITEISRI